MILRPLPSFRLLCRCNCWLSAFPAGSPRPQAVCKAPRPRWPSLSMTSRATGRCTVLSLILCHPRSRSPKSQNPLPPPSHRAGLPSATPGDSQQSPGRARTPFPYQLCGRYPGAAPLRAYPTHRLRSARQSRACWSCAGTRAHQRSFCSALWPSGNALPCPGFPAVHRRPRAGRKSS